MEGLHNLPSWVIVLQCCAAALLAVQAFSTWRLSWPGSGYMGITPRYWRRLKLEVALALVATVAAVVLVALR